LKKGDALRPLLFSFVLDYAIRRVQVKPEDLHLKLHIRFWIMLMMLIYWAEA